jgi:hypothetical protein
MKKYVAARLDWNKGFEFELAWFDPHDGAEHSDKFTAYPARLPGGVLFDSLKIAGAGGSGSGAVWDFWRAVLAPGDFERFYTLVRAPEDDVRIDAATIREIMDDITEYDVGLPTTQPSP